jgi:TRAP-type C4-dicarboxylate transport system permease large subunit
VLVVIVALYGITVGRRVNASRQRFSPREALAATWAAKWELSDPVAMIVLFASGVASLSRDGGLRGGLHDRDRLLHPPRPDAQHDLPRALLRGSAMIGAVLILLSCALGMTGYLIEAQIPDRLARIRAGADSLAAALPAWSLNGVLLVLGACWRCFRRSSSSRR